MCQNFIDLFDWHAALWTGSHFVYLLFFWWALRYFHLPAIMSNAAVNIGPQDSVPLFSVLLDISLEVELQSDVVLLCSTFWGASVFHNGCTILYFHEERTGVPTSPHPLQYLLLFSFGCFYLCFVLKYGHPRDCEVVSCGFDLHFPNDECCWTRGTTSN